MYNALSLLFIDDNLPKSKYDVNEIFSDGIVQSIQSKTNITKHIYLYALFYRYLTKKYQYY